jgi:branched-chain amino acid transport system ATP-binding protein
MVRAGLPDWAEGLPTYRINESIRQLAEHPGNLTRRYCSRQGVCRTPLRPGRLGLTTGRRGRQGGVSAGALLSVCGVSAGYGAVPVLHDVSFEVPPASIVAVLGANGAGKTTLLRALSGLVPLTAGTVRLAGRDLAAVPVPRRVRLGLAHVPEDRGVVQELTVAENLRLGGLWRASAARWGAARRAARTEVARATARVYELFEPLARRRDVPAQQLSGGERQMLALGRALVAAPRLLLLDEPSLGLAPKVVTHLMTVLAELRAATGLAVLLVEQNVHTALSIADTGVVMALGRVVANRPAAALREAPTLRQAYLGT